MVVDDWKRDELFRLFSKRTNRKDKENYIVNAIWHKLGNLDLQPVTQQCILLQDGNRAMIDLYFPQINYGVECDEEYHQNNTFNDLRRAESIEQALASVSVDKDFKLRRIDATVSLSDIEENISGTVEEIKGRITEQKSPLIWKSVQERIEDVIKRGILYDSDLIPFPTEASVGPCFGKHPKVWQKSYFSLNDEYQFWFPKLAFETEEGLKAQSSAGWINILSDDWNTIIEYNDILDTGAKDKYRGKKRITFAKAKDIYGKNAYRFIGVFLYESDDDIGRHIYKKEAGDIDLKQFIEIRKAP